MSILASVRMPEAFAAATLRETIAKSFRSAVRLGFGWSLGLGLGSRLCLSRCLFSYLGILGLGSRLGLRLRLGLSRGRNRQTSVVEVLRKNLDKELFDSLILEVDNRENTVLHLAAGTTTNSERTWQTAGAAMQMMWDIKWYQVCLF